MPGPIVYERNESAVLWCHYTVAGRRHRHSTGERDRGKALEAATRAWLEAHARARVPVPASSSARLVDLCAAWTDDLKRRLDARELIRSARYHADAEFAIARVAQRWQTIDEIGRGWELALREWHQDTGWRYLQIVTVFTRLFLRWAHAQGHLGAVPELRGPAAEDVAAEATERRPVTERQRDRILRELRKLSPRAARIYTVLFFTGARKSDLERLTLRQVNWRTGFVELPPRQTKSKARDQALWLHPRALAALRAEIRAAKVVDPAALVFGRFDCARVWARALDAAGIKDRDGLTPHHVTRHTAATLAGDKGATLAELMAFGRWATPQMAARYMKVSALNAKKAGERL